VKISVVIPALDEAPRIAGAVGSVVAPEVEVIVVDGGSGDETRRLADEAGALVLDGERGRARQLRLGGKRATGDVVLFLHADTTLESGWREGVLQAMSDPSCAGGAFRLRFASRGWRERMIEFGVSARVAALRLPYGDQALFVRRSVLEGMGGVPDVPIMEDLDLVRAIKRAGHLRILPLHATTSPRRYAARGTLRTIAWHAIALLAFFIGSDRRRVASRMGR